MVSSNGFSVNTTNQSIEERSTTELNRVWIPFAEPVPDWSDAFDLWGIWWPIHIYGSAVLFLLLSIFSLINICVFLAQKKLPQKAYFVTLNVLVFIFGITRTIFMCIDAYNARETLHPAIAYLFLSIGLPCMTSAFYLIFVAWIKATKMQRTNIVHKTRTMVIIIVVHFVASVAFDVTAGFTVQAVYLLICCQACFVIWGYTLSVMYFYLYYRIYKTAVVNRKRLSKNMSKYASGGVIVADDGSTGRDVTRRNRKGSVENPKVPLGAKIILATAIILFILACEYLAGIFGCYTLQVISGISPKPWPWWGYEFGLRLTELALCCTISLAGSRPITKRLAQRVSLRIRNSRRKLVVSDENRINLQEEKSQV